MLFLLGPSTINFLLFHVSSTASFLLVLYLQYIFKSLPPFSLREKAILILSNPTSSCLLLNWVYSDFHAHHSIKTALYLPIVVIPFWNICSTSSVFILLNLHPQVSARHSVTQLGMIIPWPPFQLGVAILKKTHRLRERTWGYQGEG